MLQIYRFLVLLVVLVAGSAPGKADAPPCADGTEVSIANGRLCGLRSDTEGGAAHAYLGIRFGMAPEEAGRWMPAAPDRTSWDDVRPATQYGAVCAQSLDSAGRLSAGQSEDCLFLNVWAPAMAPANGGKLPVMVFIHGGAFVLGAGSGVVYDGARLAASGNVVMVTLNYRLAALGFLYGEGPGGDRIVGNFGLGDQQLAMKWVQDNIASFGGDPTKVTIFGESAGAMSVGLHLFSMPSSNGLFRAAAMQSNPANVAYKDAKVAAKDGTGFLKHLCDAAFGKNKGAKECAQPGWFRAATVTTETVLKAQQSYSAVDNSLYRIWRSGLPEGLPWTPVVDADLVVSQPTAGYAPGTTPKPFIFGVAADEGALFAALANLGLKEKTKVGLDPTLYGKMMDLFFGKDNRLTITAFRRTD